MINSAHRRLIALICSLLLPLSAQGCGLYTNAANNEQVTITINYTGVDSARDYLMHIRERFPEFHIELISNQSKVASVEDTDGLLDYLSERLSVADITISNALNKDLPRLTEAFADLSGKDYSGNYQTSYLKDVAIDGSVYYLPFYLTVKGLICNKSLFDEKGWRLPRNYEEFSALLEIISSDPDDITPIYDEQFLNSIPYWISVYYALNEGAVLAGYEALRDFNTTLDATKLSLSNTLDYMSMLARTGCLREETLNRTEETNSTAKFSYYTLGRREAAMAFGSGTTWTVLKNRGFTDEFVVIPIFSPNCPEGYVLEQQTLNIGVSKAAMENPEKEAVIDELMSYITSEVGQQKFLEYSSGIKSPCYGIMATESRKFMEGILPALEKGYIVQMVDFNQVDDSFDKVVVEYLFHNEDGRLSGQDVHEALVKAADSQRAAALKEEEPVAEITENFTIEQTMYLLLNAMVHKTEADFAAMPQTQENNYYGEAISSKGFRSNILSGSLSAKNIRSLIVRDAPLQLYKATGEQILKLMDYNTSFLMLYGARMEYAYDADADTYRTTGARLPDGSSIDPSAYYTLATSEAVSIPEGMEPIVINEECILSEALIEYCEQQGIISPPDIPEPIYIK